MKPPKSNPTLSLTSHDLLSFLNIHDLVAIGRLAQTGNLGHASEWMGVSSASLSQRLSKIEKTVQLALFSRSNQGVRLTRSGAVLLPAIEQVLAAQMALCELTHALAGSDDSGRISISCPISFGEVHLTALVHAFLKTHPEAQIHIEYSNSTQPMDETAFDLVFRGYRKFVGEPLVEQNIQAQLVKVEPIVLCATPRYLAQHSPIVQPTDLQAHSCIVVSSIDANHTPTRANVWRFLGEDGAMQSVEVTAQLKVNHRGAAQSHVCSDLGVSQLFLSAAEPLLQSGALLHVLPQFKVAPQCVYLLQQVGVKNALQRALSVFLSDGLRLEASPK